MNSNVKYFFKIIFIFGMLAGVCSANGYAADQGMLLAKIISEPENDLVHHMYLELNERGEIENFVRKSDVSETRFKVSDILNKEFVLAEVEGRKAILLGCEDCTNEAGGEIYMKYLTNGLIYTYKSFPMSLRREGNEWALYSKPKTGESIKIYSLRLRARKIRGVLIGISRILVNS